MPPHLPMATPPPSHHVMKVSSSEPRDALQLERTFLTFVRFASALFFTALGIAVNFRFQTAASGGDRAGKTTYSTVVSFVLLALSLAVLAVSGVSYAVTINRYAAHKIHNFGFNNATVVVCFTAVVLTLIGISVLLIVEGYLEEER